MLKLATVFTGIGAPEQALKQLGIKYEIVFACDNGEIELKTPYEELDKQVKKFNQKKRNEYIKNVYSSTGKENFVKKSYFANYDISEEKWYEDIRFINGKSYRRKIDLLVGGSPCQSFSTYGKKKGFEDTRGTLFYHYAKLINESKPKVFIYENVPGIKSHDKGNTWKRILEIFDEINYNTYYFILNSQNYGLPQNRRRMFVVGFRKDLHINSFDKPDEIELTNKAKDYLDNYVPLKYYLGEKGFKWTTNVKKNQNRTRVNRDIIGCETANQQFNWIGDLRVEKATQRIIENDKIYKGMYSGELCVARKMTPNECLKLMGFKDFNIVVPDKEAYRQSGNSIAVPVMKALLKDVLEKIEY